MPSFLELSYNCTAQDAALIAAGDTAAINDFYYRHYDFVRKIAFKAISYRVFSAKYNALDFDDVANQIYIDLRYYDLSSIFTFLNGLRRSLWNVDIGGFCSKRCSVSKTVSLDKPLNSHSSKMQDSSFTLADMLCSDCDLFDTCFPDGDTVNRDYGELLSYMERTIKDKCKLNYVFCKVFTNLHDDEIKGGEYEEYRTFI